MYFSPSHLLILLALSLSWVIPICIIVSRTGRHWAWGLLAVFPILAIAILWALALMRWPRAEAR